jgi:hypothetical protein
MEIELTVAAKKDLNFTSFPKDSMLQINKLVCNWYK